MKRILFLILCISVTFPGCNNKKKDNYKFPKEHSLQGKIYDTEIIDVAPDLFVMDSLLITVSSRLKENFGSIYSINDSMKKIMSFGNKGRGPKEFYSPQLTSVDGNTFVIHNVNRMEVALMEILQDSGKIEVVENKRLGFDRIVRGNIGFEDRYVSKIDSNFVAVSYGTPHQFFSLYDKDMKWLGFFGDNPIGVSLEHMSAIQLHGNLEVRNGKMFYSLYNLPIVVCYEMKEGVPQKKWEDTFYESYYEVKDRKMGFSKAKSKGLSLDMWAGDKYVYILFLDILMAEYDARVPEKSKANIVLVYDHDGNRIARLNLSHRIYRLCVNEDETRIYAFTTTPEDKIISFDIPALE